jgi:hypothetical protein
MGCTTSHRACVRRFVQDFLQVMSMFGNMDFKWPPALVALFQSMSLANFNLELLAPECNFSVNFEQKWLVTQLLPVVLGTSIIVVLLATKTLQWLQRVVFKVLPFGSTSDTNLVDTCIGIFITGMFHLYLCECDRSVVDLCVSVCHPAGDVVLLLPTLLLMLLPPPLLLLLLLLLLLRCWQSSWFFRCGCVCWVCAPLLVMALRNLCLTRCCACIAVSQSWCDRRSRRSDAPAMVTRGC